MMNNGVLTQGETNSHQLFSNLSIMSRSIQVYMTSFGGQMIRVIGHFHASNSLWKAQMIILKVESIPEHEHAPLAAVRAADLCGLRPRGCNPLAQGVDLGTGLELHPQDVTSWLPPQVGGCTLPPRVFVSWMRLFSTYIEKIEIKVEDRTKETTQERQQIRWKGVEKDSSCDIYTNGGKRCKLREFGFNQ